VKPDSSPPPTARRRQADVRRYLLVLFFIVALTWADQASKAWVAANVPFGHSLSYLGGLVIIVHSYNPGTLAGFCSGGAWYPLPAMILAGGTLALILTAVFPIDRLLHKLLAAGERGGGRRAPPAPPPAHTGAAPCPPSVAEGPLPIADADMRSGQPDGPAGQAVVSPPPAPAKQPPSSFLGFGPRADAVFAALALPGAIGNVADRFRYTGRGVLDFLSIGVGARRWPTFNVADICLTVVMLLAVPLVFAAFMDAPSAASDQARESAASAPGRGTWWRQRGRAFLRGEATLGGIVVVLGVIGYSCESFQPLRRLLLTLTSSGGLRLLGAGVAVFLFAAYVRTEIMRWRSR
jgi:lipoprotein signal peptidase